MSTRKQATTHTPKPQTQPTASRHSPAGSNAAIAAGLPDKSLRPLPNGVLAPGSTIDMAVLLDGIAALWGKLAVFGDDQGEDAAFGDAPFFNEWSIGNFGHDPSFQGSDIAQKIGRIPVSYWRESNYWADEFTPCLGTSGFISIAAKVRDHSLLESVALDIATSSGGSAGTEHSWAQEYSAQSEDEDASFGLLFGEKDHAGVAGETTSSATVGGQLLTADLIFEVTLQFDRLLEGRFGPKTIELEAGTVNLLGVGL